MSIACDIDHHMHVMLYFLEIVSYKTTLLFQKRCNFRLWESQGYTKYNTQKYVYIHNNRGVESSLAKLTTYNKSILLLFSITNKFDEMKHNISRVRTFANPISIISQHIYTKCVVQCNFTIVSFMDIWSQHNPSK